MLGNLKEHINDESFVKLIALLASTAFAAFYITQFLTLQYSLSGGLINLCLRSLPLFLLFSLSLYLFMNHCTSLKRTLFNRRYLIGLVFFALCVFFEISGSSVGLWVNYLPDATNDGLIWGYPRLIRSDEYLVNVPLWLSQEFNGYAPGSDILRGGFTDVTLMPSLPTLSLSSIFNPFFWGFLLFDQAKGIAWAWDLKYIALFLITIDFFMILTKGEKHFSLMTAVILTFSPYAQWWGTANVLLFGQALVVSLYWFLNAQTRPRRILFGICIAWLCGCYLFIAYPAWLVPMFYIFAIIGIWVIIKFKQRNPETKILASRKPELFSLSLGLALSAIICVLVLVSASPAIEGMSSTIYPGTRFSTGGNEANTLFDWITSIYFALIPNDSLWINQCNNSSYFTLFPIPVILAIILMIKTKCRDKLIVALFALDLLYLAFIVFGIPEFIARITLLSNVANANRMLMATGFIDIVFLTTSLNQLQAIDWRGRAKKTDALLPPSEGNHEKATSIRKVPVSMLTCIIALVLSALVCVACRLSFPEFWSKPNLLMLLVSSFGVIFTLCLLFTRYRRLCIPLFSLVVSTIVFISGICVNPIQRGIDVLTDNPLYEEISRLAKEDPSALWVAEDAPGNLCVAAGAPTFNGTSFYPNLEIWNVLDPDGEFEEAYLRYANVGVELDLTGDEDLAELLYTDSVLVHLSPDDLRAIGAKYLLTEEDYDGESASGLSFIKLYECGKYRIYELV